jgi:hypothetical protein
MTTKLTTDKSMLDGEHNGNIIAITTWEEACAASQTWANAARRKAYYRIVRRRAVGFVLFLLFIAAVGIATVWLTA